MQHALSNLLREIVSIPVARHAGRVQSVSGGVIRILGLSSRATTGDRLELRRRGGASLFGEVLQIARDQVTMLPERAPAGVGVGDLVLLCGQPDFRPDDSWIGRIVDPHGNPLDGRPLVRGAQPRDIAAPPPPAAERRAMGSRVSTGLSVLNTILPIVRGQRVGLFAGSGVGKSHLLARLASHMDADVVVIALIGERGREVNEFVHKTLGPEGMKRSVIVTATSDQSALTRRRCGLAAMAVAEHFRDSGRNVLFLADSVTRLAEAHREVAVAAGEPPALRGFPPSVTPLIAGLCERAGPGTEGQGDITAIFSVLVAGSDMDEPIADILRGVLDGHIVLDRDIAERGRFPAINVRRSVSRSLPEAASPEENELIAQARRLLGAYERSEIMIRSGLYAEGADPVLDQAVAVWPELDAFFARPETGGIDDSFRRLELILRRSGARPVRQTG
ncbi:FliI/YscN family ATPase [Jhaorihella thermophila]|uniref:Flagellum-specific ATP synthase n=1 Tax=Jhaorihella thermophila TaxID=488547 RepID=A0A1H5XU92_9RHOB|nr:FliI/YscN family ATPase [Jhaorihella thermophila]SEG14836.1 flagellum-specific ATP synthase [Jhaorihella thermophila]